MAAKMCKRCKEKVSNRPGQLCFSCYQLFLKWNGDVQEKVPVDEGHVRTRKLVEDWVAQMEGREAEKPDTLPVGEGERADWYGESGDVSVT